MRLYQKKRSRSKRGMAASFLLFVLLAGGFWLGAEGLQRAASAQQLELVKDTLERALVTCYAIEGVYPPNLAYLEEHYGVRLDHSRLEVWYGPSDGSTRPSIEVSWK